MAQTQLQVSLPPPTLFFAIGVSTYNAIKRRYEILIKPLIAIESTLIVTTSDENIYNSPFAV